jgi:hypothetical protein
MTKPNAELTGQNNKASETFTNAHLQLTSNRTPTEKRFCSESSDLFGFFFEVRCFFIFFCF